MFFRRKFLIDKLQFPKSSNRDLLDSLVFCDEGPHKTSVELRRPTDEEQERTRQIYAVGIASCEREPTAKLRDMFEALFDKKLPVGSKKPDEWEEYLLGAAEYLDPDGTIKKNLVVPLGLLPQSFQEFSKEVAGELRNHTERIVRILRWRYGQPGPHNPILSSTPTEWSFDNSTWSILPTQLPLEIGPLCLIDASLAVHREVNNLVAEGINEPIGRELYNESLEQVERNPRSSLIMGIAAAEVGMKQYVGELVPQAQWLVEHLPSPPLVKMVEEYLPLSPAKARIGTEVLAPPKELIENLKKGVNLRNSLVHVGSANLSKTTLKQVLTAVSDLLWLLDYYRGFTWALDHVTEEARTSLQSSN